MKKIYFLLIISVFICYFSSAQVHQLWGTTSSGGGVDSAGTIFKINIDGSGFTVVHTCEDSTGNLPSGALVQAPNGFFFGTTEDGDSTGGGVIFQFDPGNNSYAVDWVFDFDFLGAYPQSKLLLATDQLLYGTAQGGGLNFDGTIFSFDPNSQTFNVEYTFTDSTGAYPSGYLIQNINDGKLYGLTASGGADTAGTLFSYDIGNYTFSLLHTFNDTAGADPYGSLVQANNGKLYGMTYAGGLYQSGVIFSFDVTGKVYTVVHHFNDATGSFPYGSLINASDSLLYGMTSNGGASGHGTIFSFDPSNNTYTDLFDFGGSNGDAPYGDLMQADYDGLLYGMTEFGGSNDDGVIFKFDQASKLYTDLHDFSLNDGIYPYASLLELISTGIAEHNNSETIQLYPNPASDQLTIKSSESAINRIEIYNMLGVCCFKSEIRNPKSEIGLNVSDFAQGVYFVHAYQAQNNWVGKFVKE